MTVETKALKKVLPELWKSVNGKRYVLPAHLRTEYCKLDDVPEQDFDRFMECAFEPGDNYNFVGINLIHRLQYYSASYFLKRDLGEAIVRTALPVDLSVEELRCPLPSFRVYLPNRFLYLDVAQTDPIRFIEINRYVEHQRVDMPEPILKEIGKLSIQSKQNLGKTLYALPHLNCARGGFECEVLVICFVSENSGHLISRKLDRKTIKGIMEVDPSETFPGFSTNEVDYVLELCRFCLNLTLFMTDQPTFVSKTIQNPTGTQKRQLRGGYYPAVFIEEPTRTQYALAVGGSDPAPAGWHNAPHWRRGHWRRQRFGLNRGRTKLIWLPPMHVGKANWEPAIA